MPECFKQLFTEKMERGKLTSINMKVSSRLHNQRTTLAEQNYKLGALLNQRPLQNYRTPYIYSKKMRHPQQRHARASMASVSSQSDYTCSLLCTRFPLPDAILNFFVSSVPCSVRLCTQSLCARDLRLPS
jgi:hypothetical protein